VKFLAAKGCDIALVVADGGKARVLKKCHIVDYNEWVGPARLTPLRVNRRGRQQYENG